MQNIESPHATFPGSNGDVDNLTDASRVERDYDRDSVKQLTYLLLPDYPDHRQNHRQDDKKYKYGRWWIWPNEICLKREI